MKTGQSIVLFHNLKSLRIKRKVKQIQSFLEAKKIRSVIIEGKVKEDFPACSLIVSLGGDGTYLNAVKYAKKVPILGINMGSLGFLTPHSSSSALSVIESFLKGRHTVKKNFFLKAKLHKAALKTSGNKLPKKWLQLPKDKVQTFIAVNDIVIERGSFNHLIKLSVFINKELAYSLKSDGIIISSPLGSTAYNLAAGGPILDTKVSCFVVTPICSHALTNRPIVIPNNSQIDLVLENTKAYLTIDGLTQCEISSHSQVHIEKDTKSFLSIENKELKNFALLKQKLRFGQRD